MRKGQVAPRDLESQGERALTWSYVMPYLASSWSFASFSSGHPMQLLYKAQGSRPEAQSPILLRPKAILQG